MSANGHYRSIKHQCVFYIGKIVISIIIIILWFAISIYHPPRGQFYSHYMYVFYSGKTSCDFLSFSAIS